MSEQDLVALTPSDLPATQQAIAQWCDARIAELYGEREDLHEHTLIAQSNGWKLSNLTGAVRRCDKRLVYYQKIKTAVEAGYLIVPNFPVKVLAVRVGRKRANVRGTKSWKGNFVVAADLLPPGEGRYVDSEVGYQAIEVEVDDHQKGGTKTVTKYEAVEVFDEPDFPVMAVKPAVLHATQKAMALKVFDEIGMVENQTPQSDPIMVGRLLDPRGSGRVTTFFVAWWMNLGAL